LKVLDPTLLAVDSNNDGVIDESDDPIEDDDTLPGKWIQVNSRDYDADGVPGFADGLNRGITTTKEELVDSGPAFDFPYAELQLTLPEEVDVAIAQISIGSFQAVRGDSYDVELNNGVYSYRNDRDVRLWFERNEQGEDAFSRTNSQFKINRDTTRTEATEGKEPIELVFWYSAQELGFTESNRTISIYAEGGGLNSLSRQFVIPVSVAPYGRLPGVFDNLPVNIWVDQVRVTVIDVDVDFGDPLTGIIAEDALSDQREEQIEFARLINLNDGNADAAPYIGGGTSAQNADYFFNDPSLPILDYLDGFDYGGLGTTPSQAANNASAKFTPMQIKLSEGIPLDTARIRILYDQSEAPLFVTGPDPQPAEGAMRIWLKNGDVLRDASPVGSGGDFIEASSWYSAADLGIDSSSRSVILYVEGVNNSDAGNVIRVEVDPEGNAQFDSDGKIVSGFVANDVVKAIVGKYTVAGNLEYAGWLSGQRASVRHAKVSWMYLVAAPDDGFPIPIELASSFANSNGEFLIASSQLPPGDSIGQLIKIETSSDPNQNPSTATKRTVSVNYGSLLPSTTFAWLIKEADGFADPTAENPASYVKVAGNRAVGAQDANSLILNAFRTFDAALTAAQVHEDLPDVPDGNVSYTLSNIISTRNAPQTLISDVVTLNTEDVNWDTVIHEYGHTVARDGEFPETKARRDHHQEINGRAEKNSSTKSSLNRAFNEGWATFYALAAQQIGYTPPFGFPGAFIDGPFYGFESRPIETGINNYNIGFGTNGVGVDEELTSARVLWDLFDAANELHDNVEMSLSQIYTLLQETHALWQQQGSGNGGGTGVTLPLLWERLTGSSGKDPFLPLNLPAINAYSPIFVAAGAAPRIDGLSQGGITKTSFVIGSDAPTLSWTIPQAVTSLNVTPTDTGPGTKGHSLRSFSIAVYSENGFYRGHSFTNTSVINPTLSVSKDWRFNSGLSDMWDELEVGNYLVSLRADAFVGMPLMQSELLSFTITAG